MEQVKEKAADIAALNGKMDEMLYLLKHIHYISTFGDQMKNKNAYYEDFSQKLNELRADC